MLVPVSADLAAAVPAKATASIKPSDWAAYLNGPLHHSFAASQKTITPENAHRLVMKWRFTPRRSHRGQPSGFLSSPTVADGAIFIGSNNGWFYKIDENTGKVLHRAFIGYQPTLTCPGMGFVDTATVAPDPRTRKLMVYVGGPTGVLYAFRASNLSTKWRHVIARPSHSISNYFEWSSPTVYRGRIYIGVASSCDNPLIRGQVIGYSQANGRIFARFFTEPAGLRGASVWSSLAASGRYVYATTGNSMGFKTLTGYGVSIIKLRATTLRPVAAFQVPFSQLTDDGDFGSSPTLFGPYLGACNKNGIFYTLYRSNMAVKWERRIGDASTGDTECSAAAVYNGRYLYIAGPPTTIHGRHRQGSIREIGPKTGRTVWATGLPNGVIGSPTMDGAGVLAVGTYDFTGRDNGIYLISARNGRIIRELLHGGHIFAQSVFADGMLFTANGRLEAWMLKPKHKGK